MRSRVTICALAAALLVAGTAAAGVRLEGVVFAEGPAESVTVQVWALGPPVAEGGPALLQPLFEGAAAPSRPFSVELQRGKLPLWIQLSARDHVALGMAVVLPEQATLPPAFLRRGGTATLQVRRGGAPAAGAVVWGTLSPGSWNETPERWRPVVPVIRVPARGVLTVVVPSEGGSAQFTGVTKDGRWGRAQRFRWRPGERAALDLDSRSIEVRVRDARGKPAAGVPVAEATAPRGTAVRTGKDGKATVQVPPRGRWTVLALAGDAMGSAGGGSGKAKITLDLGPRTEVRFSWEPSLGPLVVEPDWLPEALGLGMVAARGGSVALPWPGGEGSCRVWGPGVFQRRVAVKGAGRTIPLALQKAVRLQGTLQGRTGEPVAGAPVWLHLPPWWRAARGRGSSGGRRFPLERPWLPWCVTGADGTFEAGALPAGGLRAEARVPGFPPVRSPRLDPGPGEMARVKLQLREGATLTLRVATQEGDGVAGATVDVYHREGAGDTSGAMVFRFGPKEDRRGDPDASGTSDAEGRATVTQAPVGPARVVVRAEGYVTRTLKDVDIPAEGVDLGEVELEPATTLRGVTVDPDDRPVGGAEVALSEAPGMPFFVPSAVSDENGRFEIPGLEATGEIYLQARADGYVPRPLMKVTLPAEEEIRLPMDPERVLTGVVVTKADGTPVAGARVTASKQGRMSAAGVQVRGVTTVGRTTSGSDGRFELRGLGKGRIELMVSAEGFQDVVRPVVVPGDADPEPVTVELEPGRSVRGRVVDPAGAPAAGVTVSAAPAAQRLGVTTGGFHHARTGTDGTFELTGLPPGRYTLSAEDRQGRFGTVDAEAGTEEEVVIRLSEGTAITGRVVDGDGAPVAGAQVRSWGMGKRVPATTTEPDGTFQLRPVFPGEYHVSATAEGYAPAGEEVTVPETGSPPELTITVRPGGVVTGRVTGLSAAQLERCQVWCGGRSAEPEADGTFRMEGVAVGTQEVTASVMPGGPTRSVTTEVSADGPPAEVVIDFSEGGTLSGRVTRGGRGAAGLVVTAGSLAGSSAGSTVTGEDGEYELENLPPGEYQVAVKDGSGQVLAGEHVVVEGDAVLDLELPAASLRGWVLEEETHRPVAGARVTVQTAGLPPVERLVATRGDGSFTVDDLPPGELTVEAGAQGYTPERRALTLEAGSPAQVTLRLAPEDVLRLRVTAPGGGVPAGLWITPLSLGVVGDTLSAACDPEGLCTVRGLPQGRYTLKVEGAFSGTSMALVAAAMPGPEVAVHLLPAGVIRIAAPPGEDGVTWKVRLKDAAGGLVLPVDRWRNPAGSEWVPVPAAGLAVSVPEGQWVVEAVAPGGGQEVRQVTVGHGQPARVAFGTHD